MVSRKADTHNLDYVPMKCSIDLFLGVCLRPAQFLNIDLSLVKKWNALIAILCFKDEYNFDNFV